MREETITIIHNPKFAVYLSIGDGANMFLRYIPFSENGSPIAGGDISTSNIVDFYRQTKISPNEIDASIFLTLFNILGEVEFASKNNDAGTVSANTPLLKALLVHTIACAVLKKLPFLFTERNGECSVALAAKLTNLQVDLR